MADWSEEDSATYRAIAGVAVPRRSEMLGALVNAAPFAAGESIRIVEIGSGEGLLAETLLDRFPDSTLLALDGSASMREATSARLAPRFGSRVRVKPLALDSLDWWDLMAGADLVVSSLCLHHLNDAKKQYLYKAVAERVSERGALLVADLIDPMSAPLRAKAADAWDAAARQQADALHQPELYAQFLETRWNHFRYPDAMDQPSALFHHLVWLKHAGFSAVECVWIFAGHAVFGGFQKR